MNENQRTCDEKKLLTSQYNGQSCPCTYQPTCAKFLAFFVKQNLGT